MKWTPVPIMPTPAAEGRMFRTIAETHDANVIGVGLGGATTNIYSIYEKMFVRTVSANLGMSYSICNVLKETGMQNIIRWLPFEADADEVGNRLRNKMIRPTTIPETLEELMVEHAVAREALRLGFEHHKQLARPLRGIARKRKDISDVFSYDLGLRTYIDMLRVEWLVGTGGLLSRAPRRTQSALILIDGFLPEGVTKLAQDSVFMMPHLGVMSTVHPKIAIEVFEKDCLVRLGTCIAPVGQTKDDNDREEIMRFKAEMPDGTITEERFIIGTIKRIPLGQHERAKVEIAPAHEFDVGAGLGQLLSATVEGGVIGLIIDARGRPLRMPENHQERRKKLLEWCEAMDAYPSQVLRSAQ